MPSVGEIVAWLKGFAPFEQAESWDNVGLLLGDPAADAARVMTCLTVTADSVRDAVDRGVHLVVSHHPSPFKPLKTLTTETSAGRHLWNLARRGIALASPHTAFDSAPRGINALWAEGLGLLDVRPLVETSPGRGSGRIGELPEPLSLPTFADRVKRFLNLARVELAGPEERPVRRVAVACGSGASFLEAARKAGADVLVTGEARFHDALEAESLGLPLLLVGHFASERFAVERLAEELHAAFPSIEAFASPSERDPLRPG